MTENQHYTIGFIGLGIMGLPMACHLAAAGHSVLGWNRTPGKAQALIDAGGIIVDDAAAAAAGADIIITMVTDTPDVEQVLFGENGAVSGAQENALIIDMTTISPDATRSMADRLHQHNLRMLDAPVSGGDIGAQNASLTIMVGGAADDFAQAQPVLAAMGKRVTHVGDHGAGQAVKACNQVLAGIHMVGVCEALTLARANGLDLHTTLDVVTGGAANSWALENLGRAIADNSFDPGFMVQLILKDLAIIRNNAADKNVPLPGTSLAEQLFHAAAAQGHATDGTQAMFHVYEKMTGSTYNTGSA